VAQDARDTGKSYEACNQIENTIQHEFQLPSPLLTPKRFHLSELLKFNCIIKKLPPVYQHFPNRSAAGEEDFEENAASTIRR
jgi:hypothetical protein